MTPTRFARTHWCVVIADNHGSAHVPGHDGIGAPSVPVIYSSLGSSATLLQDALRRATHIAPSSQVMVTLQEEYRQAWEPALWFIRPEHRVIATSREASLLTGAASILFIAKQSPSNIVTVLPARCHIRQDACVASAIDRASALLPHVREGMLTLGMQDIEDALDEDYLIPDWGPNDVALEVLGVARRPTVWVAHHLKQAGAMVASGIMVGYAGVFAAHITKMWPGLAQRLDQLSTAAAGANTECEVSLEHVGHVPRSALRALTWSAPLLRQRALCVLGSGWSGLNSPRSVERLVRYYRVSGLLRRPVSLMSTSVMASSYHV